MNLVLSFVISLVCSLTFLPSLIQAAHARRILDLPGPRKIHREPVALLGGVGIFAALLLSLTFFGARFFEPDHLFLLTSVILLFFMGLRDDMSPLSPGVKLFGQFTAAAISVLLGNIRLSSLYGLLGHHQLPFVGSVAVSILLIVFMINAFNFMDGVDGLAGTIAAIASSVAGVIFYYSGQFFFAILSLSLAGSILGFLRFNITPARVFMGDSGSMSIGFLLAICGMQLTSVSLWRMADGSSSNGFLIAIALLALPAVDALQLIVLRLLNGRSPFRPDNCHFHHQLVAIGWSGKRIVLFYLLLQIFFLLVVCYFPFRSAFQPICFILLSTLSIIRFAHWQAGKAIVALKR